MAISNIDKHRATLSFFFILPVGYFISNFSNGLLFNAKLLIISLLVLGILGVLINHKTLFCVGLLGLLFTMVVTFVFIIPNADEVVIRRDLYVRGGLLLLFWIGYWLIVNRIFRVCFTVNLADTK